jgi:hypothetical protein
MSPKLSQYRNDLTPYAFCRKTYTFHLDDNPLSCIISHVISLAFDDKAFGVPDLISPEQLFRLRAKRDKGCQPIPWKSGMLDIPIFRRAIATKQGVRMSPDKALTYKMYHSWVQRLGEALGYLQTLTIYCLRRALGNAINGRVFSLDIRPYKMPWIDV